MPRFCGIGKRIYPGFAAGGSEPNLQIQPGGGTPQGGFSRPLSDSPSTGSPSSAPVCALGHLPPGRGKAGRAADSRPYKVGGNLPPHPPRIRSAPSPQGEGFRATARVAPTADTEAAFFLVEAGPRPARQDSYRERWLGKPGAEFESHRMQFWGSQAPVGREETQAATQILRAGNTLPTLRDNPVMGVWGKPSLANDSSPLGRPSLASFGSFFHGEKEPRPAVAKRCKKGGPVCRPYGIGRLCFAPGRGRCPHRPGLGKSEAARRVVAQASLSCPCRAIHLLVPYGRNENARGGPMRASGPTKTKKPPTQKC